MYRIKPLPPEQATPQVQEWYKNDIDSFGVIQGASAIYSYRPAVLTGFRQLINSVDKDSGLTDHIKWLSDVKTASMVGCPTWIDHKASGASRSGISHEKLVAVFDFRNSDLFTENEQAALKLTEAMTKTPPEVTDDLYKLVREFFSEGEIVELAARIGIENFRSRVNRCFGVQATNVYSQLGDLLKRVG